MKWSGPGTAPGRNCSKGWPIGSAGSGGGHFFERSTEIPVELHALSGVSSGGQAVLAFAKFHPDMLRNRAVHEAALGADTPIQNAGFEYFQRIATYSPKIADALTILSITILGTGVFTEDTAQLARIEKNHAYWSQYYLGTVDRGKNFEEDFAHMAPVDLTIGTWTPSWVIAANQATAAPGKRPITWVNCAHAPYIAMPKEMADIVRAEVKQHLKP